MAKLHQDTLDDIHHQVLKLLKKDAKQSVQDIAALLNEDASRVEKAIQDLESKGVIAQYTVVINEELYQRPEPIIQALIEVKVKPEAGIGFDRVAKHVSQFPNVVDHFLLSGSYDFLIVVEGEHIQQISSFVSTTLSSIDNIHGTVTHFILKKYKKNGTVLSEANLSDRLPISP